MCTFSRSIRMHQFFPGIVVVFVVVVFTLKTVLLIINPTVRWGEALISKGGRDRVHLAQLLAVCM